MKVEGESVLIVDRFEGNYAICENEEGNMVNILLKNLPGEVKEGDCIEQVGGSYKINKEYTKRLRDEIEELTKDMWK